MARSRAIAETRSAAPLATAVTGAGLAVIIAIVAVPLAAWGILGLAVDDPAAAPDGVAGAMPPTFAAAMQLALGANLVSAILGGFAGGLVASVRRSRAGAVFAALCVAWPAAILAMPLLPAILGPSIEYGVLSSWSGPQWASPDPAWIGWVSGPGLPNVAVHAASGYWLVLYWGAAAVADWVIWAPPVMAIAILHRRIRGARVVPGIMAGIALWAVINVVSIWRAVIPALVLVAGVITWAFVLGRLTRVFDREATSAE